jgi:alpha-L-fucosidase 2
MTMNSKAIVSQYRAEFTEPPAMTPADQAVDGPLLGNGDMGVAMAGNAQEHHFILCKNDLWRLAHQYDKSCPVPLGQLAIRLDGFTRASYGVTQDLYTATTIGVFELPKASMTMTCYVAATRNLLLVEMAVTGRPVNARASLTVAGGRGAETQTGRTDSIFWGTRAFSTNVDIPTGAAAAWTLCDQDRLEADGAFVVTPGKPVVLVLAMESVFEHQDYLKQVISSVSDLSDKSDLSDTRASHEARWADYWEKSFVSIDDPVIEKQYYLSLYGMGSCSRNLAFPPPIFGWTTTDNPLWQGDYHLNYNHQAPFYGLARANRLEQADPHDAPFLDFMERAAWHCRDMYGHEGGIYPVGIGPKGIETTYDAENYYGDVSDCVEHGGLFYGQRTNGSYALVNMAPRWYTTLDLDYGRRIYPFVLQMAVFWQNYVTWDEAGKRYLVESDSCHEGSGPDLNSCVSLALCRLALTLALDLGRALGQDAERYEAWQHILDHLSVGGVQEMEGKTVFRYTENGREWWKNNTIGIQQIYPAGQIDLDSDLELRLVAKNTIDVMQRWHDFNGSNSFFPAAVRVGYDPAKILHELRAYSEHAGPNGFQQENPHGIENLSTVPNTINEMLCMGHNGVIRLFPVWPKNRDAAFVNIRCWGAFLVSGEIKDGVVQDVTILSEKGSECTVVNPWPGEHVQVLRNGEAAESLAGERVTFGTEQGEVIRLTTKVK